MVLTPKIMGGVTGLHPAIILLALSIWGSLLGIVGMIIALPMTTLMISYYKRYIIGEETIITNETTLVKMPENADSNGDFSADIKAPEEGNK